MKISGKGMRSLGLGLALALSVAAVAWGAEGVTPDPTTAPTAPPSGTTALGAATGMFGNPAAGAQIFASRCVVCHGPQGEPSLTWTNPTANPQTQSYPGLNNVQNSNGTFAIDPTLFDVNPGVFVRNIDAFIQNGSRPNFNNQGATPAQQALPTMPDWGAAGMLSQKQVADVAAYIMSLSDVVWPQLTARVTGGKAVLHGSNFLAGSTVAIKYDGQAVGTVTVGGTAGTAGGQLNYGTFDFSYPLPSGAAQGTFTAYYASVDVPGVFPGGSASNLSGVSPAIETNPQGLGMDGAAGAQYAVAAYSLSPAPTMLPASKLPVTGSDVYLSLVGGALLLLAGLAVLLRARRKRV